MLNPEPYPLNTSFRLDPTPYTLTETPKLSALNPKI